MYYGIGDWPFWWMPFMGLGMLLFWGVVIGLVVWGGRSTSRPADRPSESGRPLEIAEHRYARGEITFQEFEETKTGLGIENPREVEDTSQRASRL